MALFSEAPRNLSIGGDNGTPGPTKYSVTQRPTTVQCAPFGSSTIRSNKKKQQLPGPGQYDLNKQTTSTLSINNRQIIIAGRQRFHSVFTSRSQRFKTIDKNAVPGPGQYNPVISKRNVEKPRRVASSFTINNSKLVIPSIPRDIMGYREKQDGQLQKIQPIMQKKNGQVGPGTYEPQQIKKKTGLKWSKVQSEIAFRRLKTSQASLIGPGAYDVELRDSMSKPVTSVFKSKSKKLFSYAPQTKTPGPGAYVNDQKFIILPEQTHFGSKTERFGKSGNHVPGPGSYAASASQHLFKRLVHIPFNSSQRKGHLLKNSVIAGPGSYQLDRQLKTKGPIIGFEQRFVQNRQNVVDQFPGPGDYDQQLKTVAKTTVVMRPEIRPPIKKQEEVNPTATSYTVQNFNISKRMTPSTAKSSSAVQRPFNSTADRFKRKSEQDLFQDDSQQLRAAIGRLTQRLVIRETTYDKPAIPFNSTVNREVFKADFNPGPTQYGQSSKKWVKHSFNIKTTNKQ